MPKGSSSKSSGANNKYTMMSGAKVAAPMGYTSKKVGSEVAAASSKPIGEKELTNASNIGCHAGNVYEESYTVSRCFAGIIAASMNQCAEMEARGLAAEWDFTNANAVQYRAASCPRGSERHGDVKKALVKSVSVNYVKNGAPIQILLTSRELQGRTYTQDGKRGLLSVPSESKLLFQGGLVVHLSDQIDNTFLRYANIDAKMLLRDKFVETRMDENGKPTERYVVPIDSPVGRVIESNTTRNDKSGRKDLHTVGIGPQYTVQLHSSSNNHFDLSPQQFSKAVALLVSASNRGRPINMGCLDIGIAPVTGCWKDNFGLEEWCNDPRAVAALRDVPFKVEFEIKVDYRLMGHRDMVEQQ